jgi:hypothetical protein
MLGTGLGMECWATHKRAARKMPTRKIITPAILLTMTPRSDLSLIFCTLLRSYAPRNFFWLVLAGITATPNTESVLENLKKSRNRFDFIGGAGIGGSGKRTRQV